MRGSVPLVYNMLRTLTNFSINSVVEIQINTQCQQQAGYVQQDILAANLIDPLISLK